jgi:hypothetical protein
LASDAPYVPEFLEAAKKLNNKAVFAALARKAVTHILGDTAGGLALSYLGTDALADPELFVERAKETLGFGSVEILRSISKLIEEQESKNISTTSVAEWRPVKFDE